MIPKPEELVREFFGSVDPHVTSSGYTVPYYIEGLTEPLSRVLRKYVFNKPVRALQQDFPSFKDRRT